MTDPTPTLYAMAPSGKSNELTVSTAWTQSGGELAPGFVQMTKFDWNGAPHLLGVDAKGAGAVYRLSDKAPAKVASKIDFGGPSDIVTSLVIGNRLHVVAYQSDKGLLRFYAIGDDLSLSPPYEYYRMRPPGITNGWTVLQPLTYLNHVYYATYNFNSGAVDLFSLSVTASSTGGVPALDTENVWSWTWAKGWTRFAFFTFGGENFFLKTNTMKPNVNIDHLNTDPNSRSNEVGTQMDLEDAQQLDIARAFYQAGGTPYFLTYMKSGKTTFNRVHGDCLGWTTEARLTAVTNATQIVTYEIGDRAFALFY